VKTNANHTSNQSVTDFNCQSPKKVYFYQYFIQRSEKAASASNCKVVCTAADTAAQCSVANSGQFDNTDHVNSTNKKLILAETCRKMNKRLQYYQNVFTELGKKSEK